MSISKKFLILIISTVLISSAFGNDFCDGFKRGYIIGYKHASGSILEPLTPICPLKPLKKFGDPQSDFEFGYLIGLKKGMQAAS